MNQKFNYVFCKHRNDFDYCYNHCEKDCPSVSNLWYKFIRYPISKFITFIFGKKLIFKIKYDIFGKVKNYFHNIHIKKLQKKYPDFKEENEYDDGYYKFIWGVKSWDDLTGKDSCLYTVNDIDITYNRDTKLYYLGIETAYSFRDENQKRGECKYFKKLLDAFTKFMDDNGYSKEFQYGFFCNQPPIINSSADSIEELYFNFKVFVDGYCKFYGYEDTKETNYEQVFRDISDEDMKTINDMMDEE